MIVYKRTNTLNEKVYIGKTEDDEQDGISRWRDCIAEARYYSTHLANALKKYGPKVFTSETLYRAQTQYELNRMETFFIILHQSHDPRYGYNMTLGGEGGPPTEATKKKISDAKKGKHSTKKRTLISLCYNCFQPFRFASKSPKNWGIVFCSRECSATEKSIRTKGRIPWNRGILSGKKRCKIRVCYQCFRPFNWSGSPDGVFCSRSCRTSYLNYNTRDYRNLFSNKTTEEKKLLTKAAREARWIRSYGTTS